VAFLSSPKLIFVLLNKTLDSWLQLLDGPLADLLDLIDLPAFSSDLLRCKPGLALLFEFPLEFLGLFAHKFLVDDLPFTALLDELLYFDSQSFLVLDEILNRLELLFDPLCHLGAYLLGLFSGFLFGTLQAGLELSPLCLSHFLK